MTRTHGEEVADTGNLRELHGALLSTQSVEQFLHEMAVMAARLVGGGLSCGMTMQPSGRPVTVACSDRVAARVDEVQYELDDGPCLHAMRDGHMVRIEDTTEKARWPEFEAQAASHGIRSCLALPLNADGKPVGALNLYSRQASAFGIAEARRAENFAENASGALSLAMRLASHAFAILRSASQNSNVKLRDIAGAVVTSVTGEPSQPAPPFEEGRA